MYVYSINQESYSVAMESTQHFDFPLYLVPLGSFTYSPGVQYGTLFPQYLRSFH